MKKVFNSPNVIIEIVGRREIENKISSKVNANDFGHVNHELWILSLRIWLVGIAIVPFVCKKDKFIEI